MFRSRTRSISVGLIWRVLGLLVVSCVLVPLALAQDRDLPIPRMKQDQRGQAGTSGPEILSYTYPGGFAQAIPVNFIDVLRLASLANLDIAQAEIVVERAKANVLRVQAAYLPNLSLGSTVVGHDGTIQRTEGTVVKANRDSLFIGPGVGLNVNLSDAIFLPEEAKALLHAAEIGQIRVTNETLGRVADAYIEVVRSRRRVARLDETLDFLASERESDLRGGSKGLLPLIRAFVKAGTALPSDQARVEADVVRRQEERVRAMQEVRIAAAELSRLLHLDATTFLMPGEDYRWPLQMPGDLWATQPMDVLVEKALRNRPELAENQAFLEAAIARHKAVKWRPLVPNVVANYSFGGFGGGPEIVGRSRTGTALLGHSGNIADFDTRSDWDVGLQWRLQGLGLGNVAQIRDARLRIDQNRIRQLAIQDQVVSQVVQALEGIQRGGERVAILRTSLFDANKQPTGTVYRSLLLNFKRIKAGQGLPLEVLDSTRRLSDVLEGYTLALSDYDRARFRLLIALGLPPAAILADSTGDDISKFLPPDFCPPDPRNNDLRELDDFRANRPNPCPPSEEEDRRNRLPVPRSLQPLSWSRDRLERWQMSQR
jgi:outer membrane protein TolC